MELQLSDNKKTEADHDSLQGMLDPGAYDHMFQKPSNNVRGIDRGPKSMSLAVVRSY